MDINSAPGKFYIGDIQVPKALMTYFQSREGHMIINHTEVSEALRGQHVGQSLVDFAADYARNNHMKIIPVCPFAKKVMTHNEKYDDVLAKSGE
ncbi:GNAT family N-acetyltransferase [Macrococcoides canis]|uniref:GNAT family N-acetyltransferase n=1 Tax=Macrococcoides canis TaxID=1855823 RepID=UPI0010FBC4A0|nr:GNAT family N-acetyltransferase [Macrococcus canis]QCT73784.1 N-acetyltransferase [Macrococcus canis]